MSRFMRLIVLFDLPVVSKADRREYSRFHRFLLKDGYDMMQFSVYSRIINGVDAVAKHLTRLSDNAPARGSVRAMQVTEKQYAGMHLVVGVKRIKEHSKFADQLSFF